MNEPYKKYSDDSKEILYELANQFLVLGKRGFENKEKFEPQPFSSIVNLAFSAELFLKYLHELNGKTKSGHNLKKLYNQLNDEDRKLILQNISLMFLFRGKVKEVKENKVLEVLEEHSELFEHFRYLHQKMDVAFKGSKIDFGFLLDFIGVIKTICDTRRNKNSDQAQNP